MTRPRFRVWTYAAPAIVLGCSQRALRSVLPASVEVVVREAGGGAVLAGPWLVSVSVALPPGHPWLAGGLLPSYRAFGQLHVQVLQSFGMAVRAVPPDELRPGRPASVPLAWACFGGLSPWEVVDARGRKLVGLAQRRRQTGVLLVAGTLLSPPDWPLLCEAYGRAHDAALLRDCTVSCEELLARPLAAETVGEALGRRLALALG